MFNVITKIWIFILLSVALVVSFTISIVLFIAVGIIILLTIPYYFYLKWKAKKELEKTFIDAEIIEIEVKKLRDKND